MKLYTQEQVRKMLVIDNIFDVDDILDSQTPIELPTDKEINYQAKDNYINWKNVFAFEDGAKWMRDKIQGGNK